MHWTLYPTKRWVPFTRLPCPDPADTLIIKQNHYPYAATHNMYFYSTKAGSSAQLLNANCSVTEQKPSRFCNGAKIRMSSTGQMAMETRQYIDYWCKPKSLCWFVSYSVSFTLPPGTFSWENWTSFPGGEGGGQNNNTNSSGSDTTQCTS